MSTKRLMWIAITVLSLDALITLPMNMMNTAFDILSLAVVALTFMLICKDK